MVEIKKKPYYMPIVSVILGLILIIWPGISLKIVCGIIGFAVLIFGILRLVTYARGKNVGGSPFFDLLIGVVFSALGAMLIVSPKFIVSVVPVVVGVYILVNSVIDLQTALQFKRMGHKRWSVKLVLAILMIAISLVMIFNAFNTASVFVVFMGIGLIVEGVSSLTGSFIARK